jgi:hypothetical protein
MYWDHFHSFSSTELHVERRGSPKSASLRSSDYTLLHSAKSLLAMSRQGMFRLETFFPCSTNHNLAPRKSKLQSSVVLRTCCLALHFILVAIHLVLVGIWAPELTHRVVFSLDNQNTISFLLTAISTTFGTVCTPQQNW